MGSGCHPGGRRFEHLAGLFFEGLLSPAENRELQGLLQSDGSLARRFLDQVQIERTLNALWAECDSAKSNASGSLRS